MSIKTLQKSGIGLAVILLCAVVTATAQNKTHLVKKGETLFSIAQQYNIEVEQLKQWNDISANNLSVGQSLVIKNTIPEDATIHTVEPQETLFSISKQYNVRIAELKAWNNLENNNLEIGQKLTIYPSKSTDQPQQSIVVDKETQQNTYYTVKSGDSLYRIANAHGMTVEQLKTLNDLSSNTIRVGQRLTVKSNASPPSVAKNTESSPQGKFVEYKVSGGSMSLQTLLDKFEMHEQEFQALNPGVSSTTFQPGRKLTILAPPSKSYENPYLKNTNLQDLGTTSVSKYSQSERAKPTTSGELYNPDALTAAHSNISLGSIIFIKNPENQKGIYVHINDRNSGNGLKLSEAAWKTLDFKSSKPTVTIYQDNQ